MNRGPNHARRVVITVDAQRRQAPLHVGHGLVVEPDELRCLLLPHTFYEELVLDSHAAEQIARIAPTGTEAGELLLQHDHIRTERSQFQRGR
ncbi:hypothetical protein D9M71_604460 [compost metagenome]